MNLEQFSNSHDKLTQKLFEMCGTGQSSGAVGDHCRVASVHATTWMHYLVGQLRWRQAKSAMRYAECCFGQHGFCCQARRLLLVHNNMFSAANRVTRRVNEQTEEMQAPTTDLQPQRILHPALANGCPARSDSDDSGPG